LPFENGSRITSRCRAVRDDDPYRLARRLPLAVRVDKIGDYAMSTTALIVLILVLLLLGGGGYGYRAGWGGGPVGGIGLVVVILVVLLVMGVV
jgi:hypothetical protein